MRYLSGAFFLLVFLSLINCSTRESSATDSQSDFESGEEKTAVPAGVCIWKEVSIRETPAEKGKYRTTVYLGEKLTVLPDTASETVNGRTYKYQLVKLGDGTQGWIRKEFIAINAASGAILRDAMIYRRPDLMTSSKKNFSTLDFVAVLASNNEGWAEVIGKRAGDTWFSTGWVRTENLTSDEQDVMFSVLYAKAMDMKDETERTAEIQNILRNTDLIESAFYAGINETYGEASGEVSEPDDSDAIEADTVSLN